MVCLTNRYVLPGGLVCLPSENPLLCSPEEKPQRETENTLKQLLVIEELVERGVSEVRESYVLRFHELAIDGIFPCGGQYRTTTRSAELRGGQVTHVPPEPALVPHNVIEALDWINEQLRASRAQNADDKFDTVLRVAAYALWRFNWIHPFAGGNGRTARAVAYLVLCIDYGGMIPGKPSFPTIISRRRKDYEAALRAEDVAESEGRADLVHMQQLVAEAMVEQLESVIRSEVSRRTQERLARELRGRRRKEKAARAARRINRR